MKMKETLNLGNTKFKMRGNLPVREVEWQQEWKDADVYEKRQEKMRINQLLSCMMDLHMQTVISIWVTL